MARDQKPTRLNKYLSETGIASRRHADQLISEGAVLVNGKKVYELGTRVLPSDRITVNGKPVKATGEKVYLCFNKPKHVVTTMNDPEGRPSIADYFQRLPVRVFPVGRLDWDSEGMILLTNDGDFAQSVNHPTEEILKTYLVKVSGHVTDEQLLRLKTGVSIPSGRVMAKIAERARSKGSTEKDWIRIGITEGKNRQIRYMFEKIGFDVLKLQRVAIGALKMPQTLERGEFVFLTEMGIKKIFEQDKREKVDTKERARSSKTESRDKQSRGPKKSIPQKSKREGGRQERGRARTEEELAARPARPAARGGGSSSASRSADRLGDRSADRSMSRSGERYEKAETPAPRTAGPARPRTGAGRAGAGGRKAAPRKSYVPGGATKTISRGGGK